jgi:hypothetical protein
MTIWKFPLLEQHTQAVAMPEGAEILCAQQQGAWITLWARVVEINEVAPRLIRIYSTGSGAAMTGQEKYIDTVQIGEFAWHVFEA